MPASDPSKSLMASRPSKQVAGIFCDPMPYLCVESSFNNVLQALLRPASAAPSPRLPPKQPPLPSLQWKLPSLRW